MAAARSSAARVALAALILAATAGPAQARRQDAHRVSGRGASGPEHVALAPALATQPAAAATEPAAAAAQPAVSAVHATAAEEVTMADLLLIGSQRAPLRQVQPFTISLASLKEAYVSLLARQRSAPAVSATLPEQGYEGREVSHANMQTATSDWTKEYGPKPEHAAKPMQFVRSGCRRAVAMVPALLTAALVALASV
mmetsp:Transcript_126436/g.352295  ORF Transcript_126436/g.352295 Transcript_126436/m.352295 type:complete len:198 (-) Transcript_126436:56-649(-)